MKSEDLQEEIEDILYSVQNNLGNSHLFSTDLCTDIAKEIIGTLKRHLTSAMHSDGEGQCPECGHRFLHHPECKSGCVFVDRRR